MKRLGLGGMALAAMLLLLGVAPAQPQQPPAPKPPSSCALMLDQSLSMSGFYGGGASRLEGLIDALAEDCPEGWIVGKGAAPTSQRLSSLRPGGAFGADTQLGTALTRWLRESRANRLVLVTDNVADNGSAEARDEQRVFYDALSSPQSQLTHISMLILRLPFDGLVYSLDDEFKNRYAGPRALTIYVIERRGGREDDAVLRQVEKRVSAVGFTPYASGQAPGTDEFARVRLSPFRPDVDAAGAVSVKAVEGGRGVYLSDDGINIPRGSRDGETRFMLENVEVSTGPNWDFGKAPFKAHVEFPASAEFGAALRGECTLDPPASTPGLNRKIPLNIVCTIPPAAQQLSAEAADRVARSGAQTRKGSLVLAIETRGTELSLKGPIQREFGMAPNADRDGQGLASPTEAVQARVYRLPDLLRNTIPSADRTVVIKRFPLLVEMTTSGLPTLLRMIGKILPILIPLLLLGLLAWFYMRPVKYRVSPVEGVTEIALGFGSTQTVRNINGELVRLTLYGPVLLTEAGKHRGRLGRAGGQVKDAGGRTVLTLTAQASKPLFPGSDKRRPQRGGPQRRSQRPSRSVK